jgi:ribosome-associated heat shock protein Hsp15
MPKSKPSKTPSPIGQCRVDRWLWAVRLFKTRSQAAEAIRSGRVRMGGKAIKASRLLQAGDTLSLRKGAITFRYRVIQPLEKRVGAPMVIQYLEDITPQEERDKLLTIKSMPTAFRERGSGRPTKRERRELDQFGQEPLDDAEHGDEAPGRSQSDWDEEDWNDEDWDYWEDD